MGGVKLNWSWFRRTIIWMVRHQDEIWAWLDLLLKILQSSL